MGSSESLAADHRLFFFVMGTDIGVPLYFSSSRDLSSNPQGCLLNHPERKKEKVWDSSDVSLSLSPLQIGGGSPPQKIGYDKRKWQPCRRRRNLPNLSRLKIIKGTLHNGSREMGAGFLFVASSFLFFFTCPGWQPFPARCFQKGERGRDYGSLCARRF